jgi:Bacteriophage lambda head decoration protein D
MATLTEGKHEGEFIGELAMGIGYHVDPVTVLSGADLTACTVVGKITASGKYVAFDNAGTDDGRRTAAGVLVEAVDATGGDTVGKAMLRGPAMINKNDLVWAAGIDSTEQAAALVTLLGLGIKAV